MGAAIAMHGFKTEVLATDSMPSVYMRVIYTKSASGSGASVSSYATAKADALADAQAKWALPTTKWIKTSEDAWAPPAGTTYDPVGGPSISYSPDDENLFMGTVSCQLTQTKTIVYL